jgi:hypothetical protein
MISEKGGSVHIPRQFRAAGRRRCRNQGDFACLVRLSSGSAATYCGRPASAARWTSIGAAPSVHATPGNNRQMTSMIHSQDGCLSLLLSLLRKRWLASRSVQASACRKPIRCPRLEQTRQPERQGEQWLAFGRAMQLQLGKMSYRMDSSVVIQVLSSVIVSQVGSFVYLDYGIYVLGVVNNWRSIVAPGHRRCRSRMSVARRAWSVIAPRCGRAASSRRCPWGQVQDQNEWAHEVS